MAEHMLSTSDNPFSPVTQFTEWDAWDRAAGYNTLAYLARVTITSDEISEADQSQAIESAIDDIIAIHDNGFYIRVPVKKAS